MSPRCGRVHIEDRNRLCSTIFDTHLQVLAHAVVMLDHMCQRTPQCGRLRHLHRFLLDDGCVAVLMLHSEARATDVAQHLEPLLSRQALPDEPVEKKESGRKEQVQVLQHCICIAGFSTLQLD